MFSRPDPSGGPSSAPASRAASRRPAAPEALRGELHELENPRPDSTETTSRSTSSGSSRSMRSRRSRARRCTIIIGASHPSSSMIRTAKTHERTAQARRWRRARERSSEGPRREHPIADQRRGRGRVHPGRHQLALAVGLRETLYPVGEERAEELDERTDDAGDGARRPATASSAEPEAVGVDLAELGSGRAAAAARRRGPEPDARRDEGDADEEMEEHVRSLDLDVDDALDDEGAGDDHRAGGREQDAPERLDVERAACTRG